MKILTLTELTFRTDTGEKITISVDSIGKTGMQAGFDDTLDPNSAAFLMASIIASEGGAAVEKSISTASEPQ